MQLASWTYLVHQELRLLQWEEPQELVLLAALEVQCQLENHTLHFLPQLRASPVAEGFVFYSVLYVATRGMRDP